MDSQVSSHSLRTCIFELIGDSTLALGVRGKACVSSPDMMQWLDVAILWICIIHRCHMGSVRKNSVAVTAGFVIIWSEIRKWKCPISLATRYLHYTRPFVVNYALYLWCSSPKHPPHCFYQQIHSCYSPTITQLFHSRGRYRHIIIGTWSFDHIWWWSDQREHLFSGSLARHKSPWETWLLVNRGPSHPGAYPWPTRNNSLSG